MPTKDSDHIARAGKRTQTVILHVEGCAGAEFLRHDGQLWPAVVIDQILFDHMTESSIIGAWVSAMRHVCPDPPYAVAKDLITPDDPIHRTRLQVDAIFPSIVPEDRILDDEPVSVADP